MLTGAHKSCENINVCSSSSPCNFVGSCEDARQSYRCSCTAAFDTAVLKNHPHNLTDTPRFCEEPPIMENSPCFHQPNSTLHPSAAATASNASSTSVFAAKDALVSFRERTAVDRTSPAWAVWSSPLCTACGCARMPVG